MATRPRGGRPPASRRGLRKPELIDRILSFPYRRLFGLKGCLVIAAAVAMTAGSRFVAGIGTVTLDPATCRLAWADHVYRPFHEQRILANTQRDFNRLLAEKQTALWAINAGRDPFPSKGGGNVATVEGIDNGKFFWRAYAANLEKERAAISDCLRRLPAYRFG